MTDHPSTDRDAIDELLDSFVTRFRAGERPSIEEYAVKYPHLADELRQLLPALVLLEQNAQPEDTAAFGGSPQRGPIPREIGDFTIVREIGRGGMGVVYEAVQQSLGRHVALKVLLTPALLNPTHLERFRLEARAAARLHHTHIVPVFGVGEHEGIHYYAMQFIQGQSLDLVIEELRRLRRMSSAPSSADVLTQHVVGGLLTGQFPAALSDPQDVKLADGPSTNTIDRHSDSPIHQSTNAYERQEFTGTSSGRALYRSVARVGLQVAEALAYAHQEGILHRDIKPSNLLLDARGNVWITDFGLAKAEGSGGLTQTGDFVGTLRYMAPERLSGWSDRRSDLYSLGATLYELLTLRPLYDGDTGGKLVDRILHDTASPPSRVDRSIPRDLETIVLKAISREPATRYFRAEDMAEDLRRYLADRPILSRRATRSERLLRWSRRNPLVASLTVVVAGLLLAAITILAVSNARIRSESLEKQFALERATAEAAKATALSDLLLNALESANPDAAKGTSYSVRELLNEVSDRIDAAPIQQPEVEAQIRATIGNAYRRMDSLQAAEIHLSKALELKRRTFGPHHAEVARSIYDYAWLEYQRSNPVRCEQLVREALTIHNRLGIQNEETIEFLSLLHLSIDNQRRYTEAEELAYDILLLARERQIESPEVANVMHRFAGALGSIGRVAKAEPLARQAVKLHLIHHGEDHPETGFGYFNLGKVLARCAHYDQATSAFESALAIFRNQFPPGHHTIEETIKRLTAVQEQAQNRAAATAETR